MAISVILCWANFYIIISCFILNLKPGCSLEELECGDGSCVDIRRRCDGYKDCPDGFDEQGCTPGMYGLLHHWSPVNNVFRTVSPCCSNFVHIIKFHYT